MQNMVSFFFPDLSSQLSVVGRWKLLLKIYGAAPSAKRQAALSHRVCMARVRQHISQRRLRPITLIRPVQRQLELQGECPLHVGCRRWPAACRAPGRKHGAAARSVQAARRRRKSTISAPNACPPRPPAPPSHAYGQPTAPWLGVSGGRRPLPRGPSPPVPNRPLPQRPAVRPYLDAAKVRQWYINRFNVHVGQNENARSTGAPRPTRPIWARPQMLHAETCWR